MYLKVVPFYLLFHRVYTANVLRSYVLIYQYALTIKISRNREAKRRGMVVKRQVYRKSSSFNIRFLIP